MNVSLGDPTVTDRWRPAKAGTAFFWGSSGENQCSARVAREPWGANALQHCEIIGFREVSREDSKNESVVTGSTSRRGGGVRARLRGESRTRRIGHLPRPRRVLAPGARVGSERARWRSAGGAPV